MSKQTLLDRAIVIAEYHAEKKHGEEGGNNIGKWIYFFRRRDGTGKRVIGKGDWCAAFASYCFKQAAKELKIVLPFKTSRGARRLVKNACKSSRWHSDAGQAVVVARIGHADETGGLISWRRRYRGKWHPWKGHVGIWVDYCPSTDTLFTIEGNNRKRGEKLAYVRHVEYRNGSWRKRLDRIVGF